jgi:hypothetical protein
MQISALVVAQVTVKIELHSWILECLLRRTGLLGRKAILSSFILEPLRWLPLPARESVVLSGVLLQKESMEEPICAEF